MAYDSGTFTTPGQLLSAIRAFAAANGWTEDSYAADGTGNRLHIHKGTVYLHLRSAVNEALIPYSGTPGANWYGWGSAPANITGVAINIGTGYSGASAWNLQPGTDGHGGYAGIFNVGASGTYHLFAQASPDMLFCVAEISPGIFNHLGGGMLQKCGTWTGGEWMSASRFIDSVLASSGDYMFPSTALAHDLRPLPFLEQAATTRKHFCTQVRAQFDTYTGFGAVSVANASKPSGYTGAYFRGLFQGGDINSSSPYISDSAYGRWYHMPPNTLNGIAPMIPFYLWSQRSAGSSYSAMGYCPHLRFLNIKNYNGGDILTLGSEEWMVFPGYQKDAGAAKTLNFGYAVRKA